MGILAPREEFIDISAARLWTTTRGSGPPMVLLHGGPGSYDQLEPVAEMVDDIVQVHRFEQRACARSSGSPPFTVARWIMDLEELRIRWGHESWIVAGHSFGSAIAVAYALAYPQRTRALVYMSCLLDLGTAQTGREEFLANRLARIPAKSLARMLELRRMRDQDPDSWRAELADELSILGLTAEFGDSVTAAQYVGALVADTPPINERVNVELGEDFAAYCARPEFAEELRALGCPMLIVHGDHDLRPMWAAERLASVVPRAESARVRGGHFPWLEVPDELRRALRDFLSSVVAVEGRSAVT